MFPNYLWSGWIESLITLAVHFLQKHIMNKINAKTPSLFFLTISTQQSNVSTRSNVAGWLDGDGKHQPNGGHFQICPHTRRSPIKHMK